MRTKLNIYWTDNPMKDLLILVMGTNQCWGMARTLTEAKKYAENPKAFKVWVVHKDTTIDSVSGVIYSPNGFQPWEIFTQGIKKR